MNRWAALALIEALVIVVLAFVLLGREEPLTSPPTGSADGPATRVESPPDEGDPTEGRARTPIRTDPLPRSAREPGFRAEDPVGLLVFGRVSSNEGGKLERGFVRFKNAAGANHSAGLDARGAWALPGLTPGVWQLECKARDHRAHREEIVLEERPATRRIDLTLSRAVVLRIRFETPDGKSLNELVMAEIGDLFAEVIAVATEEAPGSSLPMTPMRDQRRYGLGTWRGGRTLRGRPGAGEAGDAGVLELKVDLPVHVSAVFRHVVLQTREAGPGTELVTFVIGLDEVLGRMSGVRGKVVDAVTGEAISKARVAIYDRQSGGPGTKVNDDGSFLEEKLRPGLMTLQIHASGYGDVDHYLRLEPGRVLDLGRIEMRRQIEIEGRVVDAAGQGVVASITCCNLDRLAFPQPLSTGSSRMSRKDGGFTLMIEPGRYLLEARADGRGRTSMVLPLSTGDEAPVLIVGSSARLTVRKALGDESYVLLQVVDAAGNPRWARHVWGSTPLTRQLPPGPYTLKVWRDLTLLSEKPFDLGPRGTTVEIP